MFYLEKPNNFLSKFQIVICYLIHGDEILFLRRKKGKFQGEMWTAPGGKQDEGETLLNSIIREVKEETNIDLQEEKIFDIGNFYVRNNIDFKINIFKVYLDKKLDVKLHEDEHDEYKWVNKKDVLSLNLIDDGDNCFINTFDIHATI